jgi:hypothetical protein
VATHCGDPFEAGEAAVADNGDGALGQPAPGLQDRLDGPAGQRLVAPAAFSAGALRGREDGQERQGPAPLRPWDRQRQRQPAQAGGFDEEAARGTHRVAIDAAVTDAGAPASRDAVVGHDHHLALGQQSVEQVHQQFARQRAAIPTCFTQHLVVATEPRPIRQAHHSQRSTDSALPGRQDRASDQHQHTRPDRSGEAIAERRQPGSQQRRHGDSRTRTDGRGGRIRCHRQKTRAWPPPPFTPLCTRRRTVRAPYGIG